MKTPRMLTCAAAWCFAGLTIAASPPAAGQQNSIRVEFTGDAARATVAGAFRNDGTLYVSLSDLVHIFSLSSFENPATRKLEVKRSSLRVKFAGGNPFVVITDQSGTQTVQQFPRNVIYAAGTYFVPLQSFLPLFPTVFGARAFFSPAENLLHVGGEPSSSVFDIPSVSFEPKANGLLIRIPSQKRLREYENWLRADGWLYVTIADAQADTAAINAMKPVAPVRRVLAIQSPTSVQLTFKLSGTIAASEVVSDESSNDLLVLVRTAAPEETVSAPPPSRTAPRASPPATPSREHDTRADLEGHRRQWQLDVIVLDAGHGGYDPGSIGVSGLKEKTVTLGVVLKLGRLITNNLPGVKVVYTRKDDRFVELDRRGTIANKAGGKLFISVHANSLKRKPNPTRGFEVYLLRPGRSEEAIAIAERENSVIELEEGYEARYQQLTEENFILVTMAQSAHVRASEMFADLTQREMAAKTGIPNRGVKQAGFYVLVGAAMPNVLVETAYLSNREDEKFLKSEAGQQKIAEALFRAITGYKLEYEKLLLEGKEIGGIE